MTKKEPGPGAPDRNAAATREAKGSAQEAIGKLIGDDAARLRGASEQKAARLRGAAEQKAAPRKRGTAEKHADAAEHPTQGSPTGHDTADDL